MRGFSTEQSTIFQRNTKSHTEKANMKDNANNTMTGFINTEPHHWMTPKADQTVNLLLIKTNKRTLYHVLR